MRLSLKDWFQDGIIVRLPKEVAFIPPIVVEANVFQTPIKPASAGGGGGMLEIVVPLGSSFGHCCLQEPKGLGSSHGGKVIVGPGPGIIIFIDQKVNGAVFTVIETLLTRTTVHGNGTRIRMVLVILFETTKASFHLNRSKALCDLFFVLVMIVIIMTHGIDATTPILLRSKTDTRFDRICMMVVFVELVVVAFGIDAMSENDGER